MDEEVQSEPVAQEPQDVETTEVEPTDEHVTDAPDVTETEVSEVSEPTAQPAPLQVEEEEEEGFYLPEIPQPQAVEVQQFIDEQGNFDAIAYNQAMQQQMQQTIQTAVASATASTQAQLKYEKDWQRAYEKFPELKGNKELKDMVHAIHANSVQPGFKYMSPSKAAEKFFGFRSEAKAEGMKTAQETRTVQAAAGLGGSNPPAAKPQGAKLDQLKDQMRKGNVAQRKAATDALLSEMFNK